MEVKGIKGGTSFTIMGSSERERDMSEWQKASCVLCFNNCGFEVITEGSKIVKVRGDKENPRSQKGFL